MKPLAVLVLVFAASCPAAQAVDVYKWTDSKGVVHYGDRPASGVAASTVSVPGGGASDKEQAAAEASLDAAREKIKEPTYQSPRRTVPRARPVQQQSPAAACAAAWDRYAAAQACFDHHRAGDGRGVNEVGTIVCQELPPPGCTR